jgi:1-deoxy-D-xylulose-5-phosphate synthase
MKDFANLRKHGGLSGFPKPEESEYDAFAAGHASTAVSAAAGMAAARDLRGKRADYNIAAVIGDGSLTGGLCYEGLNNLGNTKLKTLIILNDNQMSIDKNVGALSKVLAKYLSKFRTATPYIGAKQGIERFLLNIPIVGEVIKKFLERAKKGVKNLLVPGHLFTELGFTYIGPIDGHDITELIKQINKSKRINKPLLLHAVTVKGRGCPEAEAEPDKFHGVDGLNVGGGNGPKPRTFTDVFCETLTELAERDSTIAAVTAAMADGVGLKKFAQKFPERFYDAGIAEGHAATFCAGLASAGLKPVFAVYSSFLQRSYDQIIHDVCLQNLPVVFAVDRAGLVTGDGETHQGVFDMAFLAHVPNMTVLAPRDGAELKRMLNYAFTLNSPVALRYPKAAADEIAEVVSEDTAEIAIVSVGAVYKVAVGAKDLLAAKGLRAHVYDARFVKPIDAVLSGKLREYKYVFTVEEGVKIGGFGERLGFASRTFALPDAFIEQGTRQELMDLYGLNAASVSEGIEGCLGLI